MTRSLIRPWAIAVVLASAAACVLAGLGIHLCTRPAAQPLGPTRAIDDPRLTFDSPYRNVRPDVKYVGMQACRDCHAKHTAGYLQHPMGRSLAAVDRASAIERLDSKANNPFTVGDLHYRVEQRDGRMIHHESARDAAGKSIFDMSDEVHFAVGSGARGRSYLINRDGYLFESPITWYVQKGAWELSPGYDTNNEHFCRPIQTHCLFCHSNRGLDMPDAQNRYAPAVFDGLAIGCERCHGPGELHVRRHRSGESYAGRDDTIVNPKHLEPELRESVCQQCHLAGETRVEARGLSYYDYRPGLPLASFVTIFVRPKQSGADKFVGQVEQMHASRCFQQSAGKMGCISCHDPHDYPKPESRAGYYRERCMNCHANRGCSEAESVRHQAGKGDNCVHCHMPAGDSDIKHSSISNHSIPRRPKPPSARSNEADLLELRPFHAPAETDSNAAATRALGIALMDRVERFPPVVRQQRADAAMPHLESALHDDPNDLPALTAKANAHWARRDLAKASEVFEQILVQAPNNESVLASAGALAVERGRGDAAISVYERAIAVNPWRYEYHFALAAMLARRGDWPAARRACDAALRLNPASWGCRKILVLYYLETKDIPQARIEFEKLLALHPPDEAQLRQLYEQRLR